MNYRGIGGGVKTRHLYRVDYFSTATGEIVVVINKTQYVGRYPTIEDAKEVVKGILTKLGCNDPDSRVDALPGTGGETGLRSIIGTELDRRYYYVQYLSINGASAAWQDWPTAIQNTFQGNPSTTLGYSGAWQGARAYPWEFNPVAPDVSSPWHNIIYENSFEAYVAGIRAFHFHFPFGGYAHSWLGTPLEWQTSFNSLVDPKSCQARVRGFQYALTALMDGALQPAGRVPMSDPCDVILYINGACGYKEYRDQMHAKWDAFFGDSSLKDLQLNAFIDQVADFYIGCKGTSDRIFRIQIDTSANSATPECIELHRTLPDYRSDACELADWRFKERLEAAGIYVECEARPRKTKNQASYSSVSSGSFSGTAGDYKTVEWKAFVAGANWGYFSDPNSGDAFYGNYLKNEEATHYHYMHGSYLAPESKLSRLGVRTTVFNEDDERNLISNPPTLSVVYTPYHALVNIYTAADMYLDYLIRSKNTDQPWAQKQISKGFMTVGLDSNFTGGWPRCYSASSAPTDYTWWDSNVTNTMPTFDLATFKANPVAYTGGFWTTAAKTWYNTNVRKDTLQDMIDDVFSPLAVDYRPPNALGTSAPWGDDPFYLNSVGEELRTYDLAQIENRNIWAAAWASTDPQRAALTAYDAVIPSVWMVRPPTRFDPTDQTLSTAEMDQFAADIAGIPDGRRVLSPGFLFDGGLPGNDEVNDEFYKLAGNAGATTWLGVQFNTPWPVEAAADFKDSWLDFIAQMEARGLTFNYILDDQEQYSHFTFWNRAHIGPVEAPDGYQVDVDARRVAAMVNDTRWSTQPVNSRGETMSQLMKKYASALDGNDYSSATDEDMAAYYIYTDATKTVRRGETDFPTPFVTDWGSSLSPSKLVSTYASRAAVREAFAYQRKLQMEDPVADKPYFNSYHNYDDYSVSTASASHSFDYNSHKFCGQLEPGQIPNLHLYGYNGSLFTASWGGKLAPSGTEETNPDDWYGWFRAIGGLILPDSRAHGAFISDLHKTRLAVYGHHELNGVNPNFSAWVTNPNTSYSGAFYSVDDRYAKEIWCHAAVLGVDLFMWFQLSADSATPGLWEPSLLQTHLDELATITKNQKMLSCTNATADHTARTQKLVIGDAIENAAISGGRIMAGDLRGEKLWRITVPSRPAVINGAGATLITFDNIPESPITVNATTRGAWVYSDVRPEVTVTAAP